MGTGVSAPGVNKEHAAKWDGLISELESLCKTQQSAMNKNGEVSPRRKASLSSEPEKRRRSSILKKDSGLEKRRMSIGSEGDAIRRTSSVVSFTGRPSCPVSPTGSLPNITSPTVSSLHAHNFPTDDNAPNASGTEPAARKSRSEQVKIKNQRKDFFKAYMSPENKPEGPGHACKYIGLACTAFSYLIAMKNGNDRNMVSIEDFFFTTQLPLHYLQLENISLADLYGLCKEFIDHDPRVRGVIRVEVVHMDTTLVDGEVATGERENESGDRGPPSLSAFRKTLESDNQDLSACRIFCYDPFVVEQSKMHIDDTDSESDGEAGEYDGKLTSQSETTQTVQQADGSALYKPGMAPKTKFGSDNNGAFSLCVDYNSVMHAVNLVDCICEKDIHLTPTDVPITALYRACCTKDKTTSRRRGFLRFSLIDKTPALTDAELIEANDLFCSDIIAGTGKQGIPLGSVHTMISKHIVAFAFAVHLVQGLQDESTLVHGAGIDIRDICTTCQFPYNVIVGHDMTILQAYSYYKKYLETSKKLEGKNIWSSVQLIEKKVDSEDSPPTMSIMDFHDVLVQLAEDESQTRKVMVMQFDLCAAHSVLNIAAPGTVHYGILMAYDQEKQLVKILDIHPKRYTKVWVTTLQRMHRAIIGHGYIVTYMKSEDSARLSRESLSVSIKRQDTMIKNKMDAMRSPPPIPRRFVQFFEFPSHTMSITILALCMNILRPEMLVLVKDILGHVPCDPSFLLVEKMSLNDLNRVFISYVLSSKQHAHWNTEVVNYDTLCDGTPRVLLEEFKTILAKMEQVSNELLIVQCSQRVIKEANDTAFGGEYFFFHEVVDGIVTLSDVNAHSYDRFKYISVEKLWEGMCEKDDVSYRARGMMIVKKQPLDGHQLEGAAVQLFKVPQWQPFIVSQCVHLNAIAMVLTMVGVTCCAEDVFYTAYTCIGGERFRRGSAIFPWHQLKIFMGELTDRMTVTTVAKMFMKFEQALTSNIQSSTITGSSKEDFQEFIEEAGKPCCPYYVVALINTERAFNIKLSDEEWSWKIGCCVIKHYDTETRTVYLADANPTRYGGSWSCSIDDLYEAADLGQEDKADNGLVKVCRTGQVNTKKKSMIQTDFSAF